MADHRYRPDVDGLRAVAVLLVVAFHSQCGVSGGYIGVDVFFVISGFLITGLIRKERRAGEFSLARFWARRVRRILPAVTLMVACVLIAGYWILFSADYVQLGRSAIAQQFMLGNIFFWRHTGYFDQPADLLPLLHTWSLAVEEQFYLVYPLLLMAIGGRSRRFQVVVLSVLAVGSLAISEYGVWHHPAATFFLLPSRAWELLAGGLIALAPAMPMGRRAASVISLGGMASILGPAAWYDMHTPFPGLGAVAPCAGTAALIYVGASAGTSGATWIHRWLASRPMVVLGCWSYSIYLWHWPFLAYARYTFGTQLPVSILIATLSLAGLVSVLAWNYVEQPIRIGGLRSGRPGVWSIVATGPVLVALAAAIVMMDGVSSRFSERALAFHASRDSKQFLHEVEWIDVRDDQLPEFGAANGAKRCLIWGDSHAMAVVPGLDQACRALGIVGCQATHSSTPPLIDFVYRDRGGLSHATPQFSRTVMEYIRKHHIDHVILTAGWTIYDDLPEFERQLRATIDALSDAGVQVAVMLDYASFSEDVPVSLARREFHGQPTDHFGVPWADYQELHRRNQEAIRRAASGKATVLDPSPFFVDTNQLWRAELGGLSLYRDASHLSVEGALRLKPMFHDWLAKPQTISSHTVESVSTVRGAGEDQDDT